mgnify:CR=1 FL=1
MQSHHWGARDGVRVTDLEGVLVPLPEGVGLGVRVGVMVLVGLRVGDGEILVGDGVFD